MLGLEDLLDRRPAQLSGGQRQRVAIGRAMVRNPAAFLFDEPLSNLDAQLRAQMRVEIKKLHQRLRSTVIYVTHDQVEAMTMADRIVVMHAGRILQAGDPMELYERPADVFTARFIGSPTMNTIAAEVRDTAGQTVIAATDPSIEIDAHRSAPRTAGRTGARRRPSAGPGRNCGRRWRGGHDGPWRSQRGGTTRFRDVHPHRYGQSDRDRDHVPQANAQGRRNRSEGFAAAERLVFFDADSEKSLNSQ